MTIGIIYTAFNAEDYVPLSLIPWLDAKASHLGGADYVICAVSVPFESFNESSRDRTRALLGAAASEGTLDHAIVRDKPMKETEARGAAMRWLMDQGCDTIWQVDSDELYTAEDITRMVHFVQSRPAISWFRGSLKNYVFDRQTYLVEPFTPPRIHRTHIPGGYVADSFWDDNNVLYRRPFEPASTVRDIELPHLVVPKSVAFVRHESWLSDSRSRAKVAYQWSRWGRCTFDWDDSHGGLIWRDGQPIPETATD